MTSRGVRFEGEEDQREEQGEPERRELPGAGGQLPSREVCSLSPSPSAAWRSPEMVRVASVDTQRSVLSFPLSPGVPHGPAPHPQQARP